MCIYFSLLDCKIIKYSIIHIATGLSSRGAGVGAALEALVSLGLAAALEEVAAPLAVAVSPVLAGGGWVTSHA